MTGDAEPRACHEVPIIVEYLGGVVNCDAYHLTDPRPDRLGVSSCIQSILEHAGVSPEVLFYSFYQSSTFVANFLC